MKYLLVIIAVSFLRSPAVAQEEDEEVLYCTDTAVTGFTIDNVTKKYKQTKFSPARYVINLNIKKLDLIIKNSEHVLTYDLKCKIASGNILMCTDGTITFVYNYLSKKYTYASQFGNVLDIEGYSGDDMYVSYGTCAKF